ncbi:hypothetical protein GCM10028805_16190 [Spirosoma harenae]
MAKVNLRHGRDKLRLASQLYNPEWPMVRKFLSKRYTTSWDDILNLNAQLLVSATVPVDSRNKFGGV